MIFFMAFFLQEDQISGWTISSSPFNRFTHVNFESLQLHQLSWLVHFSVTAINVFGLFYIFTTVSKYKFCSGIPPFSPAPKDAMQTDKGEKNKKKAKVVVHASCILVYSLSLLFRGVQVMSQSTPYNVHRHSVSLISRFSANNTSCLQSSTHYWRLNSFRRAYCYIDFLHWFVWISLQHVLI